MNRKQNKLDRSNKPLSDSTITVSVKDTNNCQVIQFEVPFATDMKDVNNVLWQNKAQFQSPKEKLVGFETVISDPLLDYRIHKGIGKIKNPLTVSAMFKNTKLEGLNKYKLLKCLATGGFSKVYLARSLQNGQFYAAKFVDKLKVPSEDKKILIMNQKKVNQISDYTFLVKMHEFIETQNFYVFIMDYCPGGQLFYLLRSLKRMTEEQARIYFVQILLGVEYLHKHGIMYRDLKPQNIMIDETGHIKIADFGLAKFFKQKSYSFCGSIQYMSPQIVTNVGHSFQVDYYCLGALLFQLLIGCPPFYDPQLSQYETKKNIAHAEVQFPEDFGLSKQVKDLIYKLLVKNPNQRLGHFGGAKQIMLHPWIGKINRAFIEQKKFEVPFPPNLGKFNFDPDEVGMSEERFTNKIEHEYRLINSKKISKAKKQQRQSQAKCNKSREKLISPYSKKHSQSNKKSINRKSTQSSLSHLLNTNTSNYSYSNFKGLIKHDLTRFSFNKSVSKNKSPSFMSIDKKESFKKCGNLNYASNKLYNMKTELHQTQYSHSISSNKLIQKKKLMTDANECKRQESKELGVSKKSPSKCPIYFPVQNGLKFSQFQKTLQFQKSNGRKRECFQNVDLNREHEKHSNLLKKSSKLKVKKFN